MAHHRIAIAVSVFRIVAAIVFVCVSLLSISTALAQDTGQQVKLSIKPVGVTGSYFDITLQPGESRLLVVELGNHGDAPIQARTYASDAYSIINGGFGARLDGEPTSGTTLWVNYPAETFDLAPGTASIRSFTIAAPLDVEPGEYITSIAIQNAVPTGGEGDGIVMKQVTRQVIAIAIDVPGERSPGLAIGGGHYKDVASTSVVSFDVQNTGNVLIKPVAMMVLLDADGVAIPSDSLQMGSFYSANTTEVEFSFGERLPVGSYSATVTLTDEASGATASSSEPFTFTVEEAEERIIIPAPGAQTTAPEPVIVTKTSQPWALVAVAVAATLAVVGLAAGGVMLVRRRPARTRLAPEQPHVQPVVGTPAPEASKPARPVSIRQLVPPDR